MLPLMILAMLSASGDVPDGPAELRSIAIRVHRMDQMVQFYKEAFGMRFEKLDLGGMEIFEGNLGSLTYQFVPIREDTDFEGFAVHQLGFSVPSVSRVIALCQKHGGTLLQDARPLGDQIGASIRDPDGNSIEIYGNR